MTLITWLKDRKKENTIVPKTLSTAVYDNNNITIEERLKHPIEYVDSMIFTAATSTSIPESCDPNYEWQPLGTYNITTQDGGACVAVKCYQYKHK